MSDEPNGREYARPTGTAKREHETTHPGPFLTVAGTVVVARPPPLQPAYS